MTLQQELDELLKIEESTPEQLAKIEELKASIAEEEVQKKIQSEADKVRSKYAKELKEMQDKLKAIEDAKLTEEEKLIKEKAEKEKLLAEREAQLLKKELDFDSLALLAENNLDKSFLNFLTGQTIDERKEQLNVLKGHIDLQIQEAIKSKLGTEAIQIRA